MTRPPTSPATPGGKVTRLPEGLIGGANLQRCCNRIEGRTMSESVPGTSNSLEEPLSTLQCPYCLHYIPQGVVEKLRAVGIGPSVDCPSEDCDGYMRYRLGKDGRWAVQFQERSTR